MLLDAQAKRNQLYQRTLDFVDEVSPFAGMKSIAIARKGLDFDTISVKHNVSRPQKRFELLLTITVDQAEH